MGVVRKYALLALVAYLCAVAVIYASTRLHPFKMHEQVRFVPASEVARLLSLGHPGFVADMLMSRVVLHSGSMMWLPLEFNFDSPWAYGIMDVVTDLDPKFFMAYLYPAMGMIYDFEDVHRARPLVEKGMKVFPDRWELPFWIGYDYYAYFNDYDTAASYLWQAYNLPEAPQSFLSLMLSTLRHHGDYEKALVVIRQMYEETDNEQLRQVYARRMIQLENLLTLQQLVELYRKTTGRLPVDLQELVREGMIPYLPEDPFGSVYLVDPESSALVVLGQKERKSGAKE